MLAFRLAGGSTQQERRRRATAGGRLMGWRLRLAAAGFLAMACACTSSSSSGGSGGTVAADPPPLPCGDILTCMDDCAPTDASCPQACQNQGTSAGQQLLALLDACMGAACPSTIGGVCNLSGTACDTCLAAAQATGGACMPQLNACLNDTSGGGTLACSDINNCLGSCASTDETCQDDCVFDGTWAAQSQFQAVEGCFTTACPSTGSGVCVTDTTACETCITDAQATGGACASAVATCENGSASAPSPAGCDALLTCMSSCAAGDTGCQTSCVTASSSTAQSLYQTASACLQTACPATAGSVCATGSTACQTCVTNAQTSGGACGAQVAACVDD